MRRSIRLLAGSGVALAMWLRPALALAEVSGAALNPGFVEAPPFRLALGTGVLLGVSEVRELRGDVEKIGGAGGLWALNLEAGYRVTSRTALGLRVGGGWDMGGRGEASSSGGSVGFDRSLWHAAAAARYQPRAGRGWYVSGDAGAAAIVDSWHAENESSASVTQWGPRLELALGYDVRLTPALALGLELQGSLAYFGAEGGTLSRNGEVASYVYGTSGWLGIGLVGSLGI